MSMQRSASTWILITSRLDRNLNGGLLFFIFLSSILPFQSGIAGNKNSFPAPGCSDSLPSQPYRRIFGSCIQIEISQLAGQGQDGVFMRYFLVLSAFPPGRCLECANLIHLGDRRLFISSTIVT